MGAQAQFPMLNPEEHSFFEHYASLSEDELTVELGRLQHRRADVLGAAPPSTDAARDDGRAMIDRERPRLCQLLAKSEAARVALASNELVDLVERVGSVVACFRAAFDPAMAVLLALLAIRHGLRWLCPDLAETRTA